MSSKETLIRLYEEYITLLEQVCKNNATFLFIHGQKPDPDDVVYGAKLRKMIEDEKEKKD